MVMQLFPCRERTRVDPNRDFSKFWPFAAVDNRRIPSPGESAKSTDPAEVTDDRVADVVEDRFAEVVEDRVAEVVEERLLKCSFGARVNVAMFPSTSSRAPWLRGLYTCDCNQLWKGRFNAASDIYGTLKRLSTKRPNPNHTKTKINLNLIIK